MINQKDQELCVLLNIFKYGNFQSKWGIESKDFMYLGEILFAYEQMIEESTASPTDYKANVIEACRRSERSYESEKILEADEFNAGFAVDYLRLIKTQKFVENLSADMKSLSRKEMQQRLTDFITNEPQDAVIQEVDVSSSHESYARELEARKAKFESTGTVGIMSGFEKIDSMLAIEPGQMVTLAARPSVGKSALALNIAYNAAMFGANVLYLSLEMSPFELTNRLYSSILKISNTRFKYGNVDKAQMAIARQEVQNMPGSIRFVHCPGLRVQSIETLIRRKPVNLLILDHIDLMPVHTKKGENEATAIGRITATLKSCAPKYELAVLCLSQFNRESKGSFPELHQLRGSGAKEQDSDIVMILHRELDPDADPTAILRVAKNRNGQCGDILLHFDGPTTTFT